ncbi:Clavaminate synthase-like protein [Saitoella complicata NRRL Y-17804]|uniref:Clavaminate synthase-like protein n=1 Tax=Saitoella complicata (strain BCRC 22490 / CBS 7301 / JCM 7358 / NBRC 10748 / NRRL Y-17804) TaxID=698492 RepID=UPI0008669D42|nr:Clavaminate synthase-like protein [Saitoella complicata NRRL Y-17804]ODQ51990.1 Clavaminate synthase-like protein [Saitoella complicata NRRL Y-17804]
MTLITTGGGSRKWDVLSLIEHMDRVLATATKISAGLIQSAESSFECLDESSVPAILRYFDRVDELGIGEFQEHLLTRNTPLIITEAMQNWPAVYLESWSSFDYLLNVTSNGQRLVPVEIGDSYVSKDWTQKVMPFKEFLETYILNPDPPALAYLAQHDLFSQIPRLREDIRIPDYCYADHETALEEPIVNAWFGPKGTVSPLHKDPYCNIFAQVAGYKYWKNFPESETENLYPRGEEDCVDMSNTSQVDVDGAVDLEKYPKYAEAQYREGILGPGEMLFVPKGSWHFVKSLTPSYSVSFWF